MKNIITIAAAVLLLSATAIAGDSFPAIDAAIESLRNGTQPSEEMLQKCMAEKEAYHQKLVEKYNTTLHTQFGNEARMKCYILMIKMALIDIETYENWPFRYALRFHVANELEKLTSSSRDPYLHFSAIFSSLSRHKTDHAIQCLRFLQRHDPFLAETATTWVATHLSESRTKTTFLEAAKKN